MPVNRAASVAAQEEKRMMARMFVLAFGLLLAASAQAVCYKDGKPYPTGAEVGGYVCQADGTWRRR